MFQRVHYWGRMMVLILDMAKDTREVDGLSAHTLTCE